MYTLTAWINLINWHVPHLDYVVVLGAGIMGKTVTPLLAARITRGIEIYQKNPGSKLIMSGGQGPGEDIPEAEAMAEYAINLGIPKEGIIIENKSRTTNENLRFSHALMKPNSKFCIVTNSYYVYRALVLGKRQGLQCIGYGAKTKWHFTLNAFVREFIAYLVITKRIQITVTGLFAVMTIIAAGERIALIGPNGIGKSTLLNLIRNKIQPDHGRIIHHGEINYIPQIDYTDTINDPKSAGEKRLTLIENIIWLPGSLLLLDEPTVYLDENNIENLLYLLKKL